MIRKTILQTESSNSVPFLNLEALARFEISSENPRHPFENALRNDATAWKASEPGPQVVRVMFDVPQTIQQIHLEFDEAENSRTQEFSIFWQRLGEESWTELRRQQFNFSPGTSKEVESFDVRLHDAGALELRIIPSIDTGGIASLTKIALQ